MQVQYYLWSKLYPVRNSSPDPEINAKIQLKLEGIIGEMCHDFTKLQAHLIEIGRNLGGHYSAIRLICDGIATE